MIRARNRLFVCPLKARAQTCAAIAGAAPSLLSVNVEVHTLNRSDEFLEAYKKSGRGPPTAPTLRPRVLTPRDHFVHRGGGGVEIIHQSHFTSHQQPHLFFIFFF